MISWPISGHIVFLPRCCFKELHEKQQWGTWLVLSPKYIKAPHVTFRMHPPHPLGLSLVPLCKPSDQLSVFIYRLNALTQHQVSSAARSALAVSHWDSVRSSSEGAVGDTSSTFLFVIIFFWWCHLFFSMCLVFKVWIPFPSIYVIQLEAAYLI